MFRLITVFLVFSVIFSGEISPCPRQYDVGSVFSAQIIVSNYDGHVSINEKQDIQCYNYNLPYKFVHVPQVAIAVYQFGSKVSNDFFFSIKPMYSESVTFIPFIIRTHWKYTRWTRIAYSFLAEDRIDVESGYYMLDGGSLQGCQLGKKIQVFLPFYNIKGVGQIHYNLFLHGFQISIQTFSDNKKSPFQIQLAESFSNSSGITVLATVTTITKVHTIHISYFAYYHTSLSIIKGTYIFDSSIDSIIEHSPRDIIGRNYARIHGITGFIINFNNQDINYKTQWTGSKFIFDMDINQRLTHYFSYSYIFLMGSECSDCPGFPLTYESKCVNACPINYFVTPEQVCLTCGDGQYWNGTACQKVCPVGKFLNFSTNKCECPSGLNWNRKKCISCSAGKVFNQKTYSCECPVGLRWNGYGCANIPICQNGKYWNVYTYSCQCPLTSKWNGTFCDKIKNCFNGQILNNRYQCVCPQNTYWSKTWCQPTGCIGGQKWNGTECQCQKGFNFNGILCIQCINGQIWNQRHKSCVCEKDYKWNGNFCQKIYRCSGGRVFNQIYGQCICKQDHFWNGNTCIIKPKCCCGKRWNQKRFQCECPQGFYWNKNVCVQCINGKVWNQYSKSCKCLIGTQWNGNFCVVIQKCHGGMIWNQNTWACECPSTTVWNGNYCIANPCSGGRIWDNIEKSCICVNGKIFYQGYCIPPQIACTNGRLWDQNIYACRCPHGTWYSGNTCERIKQCKNNQIYNPLNNKCQCSPGFVWLSSKQSCVDPTCQVNKRWDGYGCVDIICPPGSFYNGTQCICPAFQQYKCNPWQYFDGVQCIYFPQQCPFGTHWNKTTCVPINNECPIGTYKHNRNCKAFPQKCAPSTKWIQSKKSCKPFNGICPTGTYLSDLSCQPYIPCQYNQTWNPTRFMCICPDNTQWNGKKCIPCLSGKIWIIGKGCQCPQGNFFQGQKCNPVVNTRCTNIPNSVWKNKKCICKDGFDVVGIQCICKGIIIHGQCNRCAYLPNSQWHYGKCRCIQGYTLQYGKCLLNSPGNDDPSYCNVGTFFDFQQRKCIACPDGCLSCKNYYSCNECRPQFNYDSISQLCIQHCGDGKKFILDCDDGNNIDGDGCSMDCYVQPGYICRGGSPNQKDFCLVYQPNQITIIQTGQVRYEKKIVINVKIDYLPKILLQSIECNNRCSSVLVVEIKSGDTGAVSIKSQFIPGTAYAFSIQIDFGRSYIGQFSIQIKIDSTIASKFFNNVRTSNVLLEDVKPIYLAKNQEEDILS